MSDTPAEEEATFEAFCAASRLEQSRRGYSLPSAANPNSFSYRQWRQVARYQYNNKKRNRSPMTETTSSASVNVVSDTNKNVVVDDLSKAISRELLSAMGPAASSGLHHHDSERFPMPSGSSVAEIECFLSTFEVAARLAIASPSDVALWDVVLRMRVDIGALLDRDVVLFEHSKFPALRLLLDLLSLNFILRLFDTLPEAAQHDTLLCGEDVCAKVRSEASTACVALLRRAQDSRGAVNMTELRSAVASVMASVPYQFIDACRDALAAVHASSVQHPTGVLCLSQEQSSPGGRSRSSSATACSSAEEDLLVGDMISTVAAPRLSTGTASAAPAVLPPPTRSKRIPQPPPVRRLVPSSRTAANQHDHCSSRYHAMYADPSKHASRECRFCTCCHMMEILFNGWMTDCVWKHWPTERRIKFHLKRFPEVTRLALERFGRMQREGVLPPTSVPTS